MNEQTTDLLHSLNNPYMVGVSYHCDYYWQLEQREIVPTLISNPVSYDGDEYCVLWLWYNLVSAGNTVGDANTGNVGMQKKEWRDAEALCVNNAFLRKYR